MYSFYNRHVGLYRSKHTCLRVVEVGMMAGKQLSLPLSRSHKHGVLHVMPRAIRPQIATIDNINSINR
jgi:hypothetical protein